MSGIVTLVSEITNITKDGFWLFSAGYEYFVSFNDYPDFKKATIEQLHNFIESVAGQFHWPDLDCDIELEALITPEKYPLKFQ